METFGRILLLTLAVTSSAAPRSFDPAKFTRPIRVACVGDGITEGVGNTPGRSYPAQLQELLGPGWLVGNFGVRNRTVVRTGDFPYWLGEPAFQAAQDFQPDVVILLLGASDTTPQNRPNREWLSRDYADLADRFIKLPSQPVLYVCRP